MSYRMFVLSLLFLLGVIALSVFCRPTEYSLIFESEAPTGSTAIMHAKFVSNLAELRWAAGTTEAAIKAAAEEEGYAVYFTPEALDEAIEQTIGFLYINNYTIHIKCKWIIQGEVNQQDVTVTLVEPVGTDGSKFVDLRTSVDRMEILELHQKGTLAGRIMELAEVDRLTVVLDTATFADGIGLLRQGAPKLIVSCKRLATPVGVPIGVMNYGK